MQVDNVVCAFCGCVCDDISVTVEDGRITQAKNACVLGKAWFLSHGQPSDRPAAMIDGQPASLDDAVDTAARILAQARYPLIYGLSSTSCEAQRQAVALAEALGGCIDCCTSVCHGPSGMALQGIGEPTCTLGEVKNRADLIVYWGSNPGESHPRHMARYAVTPKGMFIPRGRKDRTVVLVDVRPTPSARAADIFLQVKPGKDFELLWSLRALVKGQAIDEAGLAGTGLTLAQLTDLAERMKRCKFGVLFIGQGLTQSRGKHLNTSAAFMLVRDLNSITKFALMPMRGHGNVTGIDNVLGWQTGYPFRGQLQPGLSPLQSRRVYRGGCAQPERGRCGLDHRFGSGRQSAAQGRATTDGGSDHRAGHSRERDHAHRAGGLHHRHRGHLCRRNRLPHG